MPLLAVSHFLARVMTVAPLIVALVWTLSALTAVTLLPFVSPWVGASEAPATYVPASGATSAAPATVRASFLLMRFMNPPEGSRRACPGSRGRRYERVLRIRCEGSGGSAVAQSASGSNPATATRVASAMRSSSYSASCSVFDDMMTSTIGSPSARRSTAMSLRVP